MEKAKRAKKKQFRLQKILITVRVGVGGMVGKRDEN